MALKTNLLLGLSAAAIITSCTAEKATPEEMASYVNQCPAEFFDKSAKIFDAIDICANKDVSQDKLVYAAAVTAQWLDNNQDGKIDDRKLLKTLKKQRPVVVMSSDGFSMLESDTIFTNLGDRPGQDLSAAETNPEGDRRDASQEEIHHIIMNAGWIKLYPKIFSDQKTEQSKLYKVWKYANDNGYYQYNDPTCDDACKVTEFVYLASAAYLGADADLQSDEMMLKNQKQLQSTIPEIIEIFENKDYNFPTSMWPNGDYPHTLNIEYFPK